MNRTIVLFAANIYLVFFIFLRNTHRRRRRRKVWRGRIYSLCQMSKAQTPEWAFCKQQCNLRYVLQGAQTDGVSQSSWHKSSQSTFVSSRPLQCPILLVTLTCQWVKSMSASCQGEALHTQYLNWQLLCLSTWSVCLYPLLQCCCHASSLTAEILINTVHGD